MMTQQNIVIYLERSGLVKPTRTSRSASFFKGCVSPRKRSKKISAREVSDRSF